MGLACVQDELGNQEGGEEGTEQESGAVPEGSQVPPIFLGSTQRAPGPQFSHESFTESLLFQTSLSQIKVSSLRGSSPTPLG